MSNVMTVKDLNREQLNELKETYFSVLATESEQEYGFTDETDIPDEVIFNYYNEMVFTNDDFFCSCRDHK